jgi:hypothetical protein
MGGNEGGGDAAGGESEASGAEPPPQGQGGGVGADTAVVYVEMSPTGRFGRVRPPAALRRRPLLARALGLTAARRGARRRAV